MFIIPIFTFCFGILAGVLMFVWGAEICKPEKLLHLRENLDELKELNQDILEAKKRLKISFNNYLEFKKNLLNPPLHITSKAVFNLLVKLVEIGGINPNFSNNDAVENLEQFYGFSLVVDNSMKNGEWKLVPFQDKNNSNSHIFPNSMAFGKTNAALLEFFYRGKKGESIVYATPEGNFLSPKAAENAIKNAYMQGQRGEPQVFFDDLVSDK